MAVQRSGCSHEMKWPEPAISNGPSWFGNATAMRAGKWRVTTRSSGPYRISVGTGLICTSTGGSEIGRFPNPTSYTATAARSAAALANGSL